MALSVEKVNRCMLQMDLLYLGQVEIKNHVCKGENVYLAKRMGKGIPSV